MGKRTRPRVVAKDELDVSAFPDQVSLAMGEIAASAKEGLLALSVAAGLEVMGTIFEHEVTAVVGPKGRHDPDRVANRHGTEAAHVVLGGRQVSIDKPRVRSVDGHEIGLETYRHFADTDLLTEIALGRMLAGLSTRRYDAGAEPVGDVAARATSRSAVSRRFKAGTTAKLAELFGRDLSKLDLVGIFVDGIGVGDHVIVVALGVGAGGTKHPLGLWEGTTENATVCKALLGNLIDRGLDPERPVLCLIDGGKGIRAAIKAVYGDLAPIQRCRIHKTRNVTDHLPHHQRVFIARKLRAAWVIPDPVKAAAELRSIARHLDTDHPGAAASLLEGLEETLTVNKLRLPPSLLRTFASTNPIESMISIARDCSRNVTRWRNGRMALRWIAAGMLQAEKQFRRINGYRDLHVLARALERHKEVIEEGKQVA
ncbi:MAG TPA: IS256 family transposase [Actinomycetota bacterium]